MATTGYTYGIRNALQNKGVTNNRIGYNSKTESVTIDGKDFIKPGTVSNGIANSTQAGFNTAWSTFNAPAKTPVMTAAANAVKAAQQAQARVTAPKTAAPVAAPTAAYNPVTPQQSTLDAIQKAVQQQQGFQFSGPAEPFSYDQTTDPAYQAQLSEAKRQVGIQQRDTNAMLRGTGQGKSSYSESVAAQSANNALAGLANNLVPQLMQQAFLQYQDKANRDVDIQKLNYGVGQDAITNLGNQYTYQNEEYFRNPLAEAEVTGNYLPQGAKQAITELLNLKGQAEAKGVTKEARDDYSKQATAIRTYLDSIGINSSQYGANVNQATAAAKQNTGIRTLAGQETDLRQRQANLDAAKTVSDLTGRVVTPQSDWTGLYRQSSNPNAPLTYNARQDAITNAQEDRRLSQTDTSLAETKRSNMAGEQATSDRLAFDKDSWAQEFKQKVIVDGQDIALRWAAQYLNEDQLAEVKRANQAGEAIDAGQLSEMVRHNMEGEAQGWADLDYEGQKIAMGGSSGGGYEGMSQSQIIDSIKDQFSQDVKTYDKDGFETGTKRQYPKAKTKEFKEQIYRAVTPYRLPADQEDQTLYALGLTEADIKEFEKKYPPAAASTSSYNGSSGGATQASFKSGSSGIKFTNGTSGYNNYYQAQKFVGKPAFNSSGAVIAQAIKDGGYESSWLAPVLELVARESSFNPNAANPESSARGLFQFLDMTRNNYGGSKVNWSDPYQQAVAGLKYIKDRYKNPTRALQYWDKNKSY